MLRVKCIFGIKPHYLRFYENVSKLYGRLDVSHARVVRHASNLTSIDSNVKPMRKNIKTQVDPKVEDLEDKIIYCDHLHYDYVKMGFKQYTITKQVFDHYAKMKFKEKIIHEPAKCIALQYLDKDDITGLQQQENEPVKEQADEVKQVHMPYARVDNIKFTEVTPINDHSGDETSLLNERYKLLYERYLKQKASLKNEGKDLTFINFLSQLKEDMKVDETSEKDCRDIWMTDYEDFNDTQYHLLETSDGTPAPDSDVTSIPCGGCGALLHCKDPALPGYLPSEILLDKSDRILKHLICKRCHFLKFYNTALEVNVSPEEYPKLLKVIKTKKCAVIVMVDLTDFPCSIWHDLKSVLHPLTVLFVVGNKVDLLPKDHKHFFTHVQDCLLKAVSRTGIRQEMVKYVGLISAKTGYGIEELINKIHLKWGYKGDIYMIGCTNVGKSSLFNTLLTSDLCKSQAVNSVQRATISPWPGTTINLLKFPILNPQRWRLYMRAKRLTSKIQHVHTERMYRIDQFKASRNIKYATLQGDVEMTFDPEKGWNNSIGTVNKRYSHRFGINEADPIYALSRWCYDTPGTMQPDQVLNLLTTDELLLVLPRTIIMPRTLILYAKQTIFLAGLGRLDFLEGETYIRCTMFMSDKLPLTVCYTEDADELYQKLLHTKAFAVPISDPKRLEHWPGLEPQEIELTSDTDYNQSCADIVLSSAGWIAITPQDSNPVKLKAWTPQGRGIHVRSPALLPYSVKLRGCRIDGTPLYTKGQQVYAK